MKNIDIRPWGQYEILYEDDIQDMFLKIKLEQPLHHEDDRHLVNDHQYAINLSFARNKIKRNLFSMEIRRIYVQGGNSSALLQQDIFRK